MCAPQSVHTKKRTARSHTFQNADLKSKLVSVISHVSRCLCLPVSNKKQVLPYVLNVSKCAALANFATGSKEEPFS